MAKLTMFSRLLITIAIVAAVYFGVRQFFPQLGGSLLGSGVETPAQAGTTSENNSTTETPNVTTQRPAANAGAAAQGGKFNYSPPAPVSGKLKGVVEVGAQGFNSFIIRIDTNKNWKKEKADYGTSLVYEKLATNADIREGLKTYISDMLNYGVSAKDIHFVVSSGAKKVSIMDQIINELRTMGYVVNTVTPEQEAKYAFRAAMPNEFAATGFVVDIGSGNTKIAWRSGGAIQTREASGAKYFQNNVSDATVYSEVSKKSLDISPSSRKICFIIGGVPYELAKQSGGKVEDRYTQLGGAAGYSGKDAKQKAGINIYKAIADATGCEQFVFPWDANFTLGFLLELKY